MAIADKIRLKWAEVCDLCPSFAHHRVFPLVLAWCVHHCQTLKPKSIFVSFCASVWGCFHLCMNGLWLWGCTCPSVDVCVFVPACEWQRVLNMCWRSQRNSRALIRTSPRWQLVNSVLRKGVLYSCTKECKLVPMPSGHWEQIHMAHTHFILKHASGVPLWCKFLKEKQAQLMRHTRTVCAFIDVCFPSKSLITAQSRS